MNGRPLSGDADFSQSGRNWGGKRHIRLCWLADSPA